MERAVKRAKAASKSCLGEKPAFDSADSYFCPIVVNNLQSCSKLSTSGKGEEDKEEEDDDEEEERAHDDEEETSGGLKVKAEEEEGRSAAEGEGAVGERAEAGGGEEEAIEAYDGELTGDGAT